MKFSKINISRTEALFQIALFILVFIFYSFDRQEPHIHLYQIFFFLNYVFAVLIINYFLLPRYFYNKRYWHFLLGVIVVLVMVIIIEELVLEQIYFADTRGKDIQNLFYFLVDVLPVIAILSGFKFGWDVMRKQREVEELKASMQESELSFLKSQINPHFLFNNLNNLYSYALENSPKTPVIILELSAVLRYMLYDCREKYVPLEKELKQLENFIRLYELQIEDRGKVTFNVSGKDESNYRIAPLILMVFVENAFKHSTASQGNDILIDIQVNLDQNGVLLFHCNNSYRNTSNGHSLSEGIGLENARKRLDLIYPQSYSLEIEEISNYYKVKLSIALN